MAEFVFTNNCFAFGQKLFRQIPGTVISTKFTPSYACIFIDKFETDFLKMQKLQPFDWFRYIYDVFFI